MANPTDKPAIEEKIENGEVKVQGGSVKVPMPEKTEKALKKKAKKNGTTSDKVAEEIIKENLNENKFEGFINPYGFLHLGKKLIEKFGAKVGEKTDVTIELQGDTLIIKRA